MFIPLVLAFVPESVSWLCQKQPRRALERINAALARMGHATVGALPALAAPALRRSVADILKPGLIATTLLITQVNQRPLHQQAGQPKVFADPSLVDPKTLLPRAASAASR